LHETRRVSHSSGVHCARCDSRIPAAMIREETAWRREGNGVVRFSSGAIATKPLLGVVYCPNCAPDVAICKRCGCTDECACPGGCTWVTPACDLCSCCVETGP